MNKALVYKARTITDPNNKNDTFAQHYVSVSSLKMFQEDTVLNLNESGRRSISKHEKLRCNHTSEIDQSDLPDERERCSRCWWDNSYISEVTGSYSAKLVIGDTYHDVPARRLSKYLMGSNNLSIVGIGKNLQRDYFKINGTHICQQNLLSSWNNHHFQQTKGSI